MRALQHPCLHVGARSVVRRPHLCSTSTSYVFYVASTSTARSIMRKLGALVVAGRSHLPTLFDEHDVRVGLWRIHEVDEPREPHRIAQRGLPFALVVLDVLGHVGFELRDKCRARRR